MDTDYRKYEKEMEELYKRASGQKSETYHSIVCPTVNGKVCKLCEQCKEVLFDKSIGEKDPIRLRASNINGKFRYYSNVVFLSNPTEVVVFEYGDKIAKALVLAQNGPVTYNKDFMDPIKGRNVAITKISGGGDRRNVDYKVAFGEVSPLVDKSVLTKMNNLGAILQLIENGLRPFYQSKLQGTTEMRILQSWLGAERYWMFFKQAVYHYNITDEEFNAVLGGELNAVTNEALVKVVKQAELVTVPPQKQLSTLDTSKQMKKLLDEWGIGSNSSDPLTEDNQEPPICFSDVQNKPECKECGWNKECSEMGKEKIAIRMKAKGLHHK